MKIKHYSSDFGSIPIHHLVVSYGESNTDKSFFRPDISSTRAFLGSMQGSNRVGLYDFPDGKDTGETFQTFIRDKALDITEVDSAINKVKSKLEEDIEKQKADKKAKEVQDKADKLNENVQKLVDSNIDSSSSVTES